MWVPSVAEVANGTAEANLILQQYQAGATGWVVNQPGVAGALVPLTPVGGGPIGPGGGGGAALAGPQPGAAGLGIVPPGDAGQNQVDLRQLESAVQQLQAMALSPSSSQRSKKKKKKTKSDKKDKRHKKSKKRRRDRGAQAHRTAAATGRDPVPLPAAVPTGRRSLCGGRPMAQTRRSPTRIFPMWTA